MELRLIKIRIGKFQTGRKFCREIFLDMPTNEKMIRIISIGDELRDSLLERLRGKQVEFLVARLQDDEADDPDQIRLYLDETPKPVAPAIAAPPAVPKAPPATPKVAEPIPKPTLVEPASQAVVVAPEPLREQKGSVLREVGQMLEEAARKFASALEEESKVTIESVTDTMQEAARKLGALGDDEDKIPVIIEGVSDVLDQTTRNLENHSEEDGIECLKADAKALEETSKAFAETLETNDPEKIASAAATIDAIVKSLSSTSTLEDSLEEIEGIPEDHANEEITASLPQASQESDPSKPPTPAMEAKSDQYKSPARSAHKEEEKLLSEAKKSLWLNAAAKAAKRALEKKADAKAYALATRLNDAIDSVLVGGSLPAEPDLGMDFQDEIEALTKALSKGSATEELEQIFRATDEALKEREVWIKPELTAENEEEIEVVSDNPSDNKRIPNAAARLAPFLAHSLGYLSPSLLSDISLAAIVKFAKKEGQIVNQKQLPPGVDAILGKPREEKGNPISDAQEILQLLEGYLENWNPDPTTKEFGDPHFLQTLQRLGVDQSAINPWNHARWNQMTKDFVPIDTFSRCTRASNAAWIAAKQFLNQDQ